MRLDRITDTTPMHEIIRAMDDNEPGLCELLAAYLREREERVIFGRP